MTSLLRPCSLAVAALFALAGTSCDEVEKAFEPEHGPTKMIIVFVDTSSSVPDSEWTDYARGFETLVRRPDFAPGDRMVLGTISATTLTNFKPVADVQLPRSGVALKDERDGRQRKELLIAAFGKLERSPDIKRTRIVDSLDVARALFANAPEHAHRHVVYFSDMIEDTERINLAKGDWTEAKVAPAVEGLRKAGALPDMPGIRIHVLGARAETPERMRQIEGFWRACWEACGAQCADGSYGRPGLQVRLEP